MLLDGLVPLGPFFLLNLAPDFARFFPRQNSPQIDDLKIGKIRNSTVPTYFFVSGLTKKPGLFTEGAQRLFECMSRW